MAGKEVSQLELSEAVFGIEPNQAVMHDMVKNYLANQRQGTQSALTRAEVSGGGKKPWRQKGYRPRPSGFHPGSPVDPRRRGIRAQAQGIPLFPQQEGAPSGNEGPRFPARLPITI